jgi:TatD DNase family protein
MMADLAKPLTEAMMQFTDSHCHLDNKVLNKQLPTLLTQCAKLAINRIIIPAISPDNFDNVLTLAKRYHNNPIQLYPCLGIHPWFLDGLNNAHLEQLSAKVTLEKNNIIAIGETGIDGANIKRSDEPEKELAKQQHFFDFQLNLAKQSDLPVIIHHRQSHQYIVPMLRQYKLARAGVIHGFSGSYQQAKDYLDLGFKLGIGSTITYSRAKKTINTVKRLPLESLILETDAPSMPLSPEVIDTDISSKALMAQEVENPEVPTNSPVNLIKIFDVLTTIRTENPEAVAEKIERNIEQMFFT